MISVHTGRRAFIVYPLRSTLNEADKLQQGGAVGVELPEGGIDKTSVFI